MKNLLCVGSTLSYLDQWTRIAEKLDLILTIMETPERIAKMRLNRNVRWIAIDSDDPAQILLEIRRQNGKTPFDGIFTSQDKWLCIVAQAAMELGLPGLDPETARKFSNKNEMKKVAQAAGLIVAKTYSSPSSVQTFPVIVKPNDKSGSVGVTECKDLAALENALKCAQVQFPASQILIEEKLSGKEISIEACILNGVGRVMGVTEKFLFGGTFVEQGHISPFPNFEKGAQAIVDRIVRVVPGIDFGALHIEGFINDSEFTVGEIHLRFAGDSIVTLTEKAGSVEMIEPIFKAALGMAVQMPEPIAEKKYFGISFTLENENILPSSSQDRTQGLIRTASDRKSLVRLLELRE